MKILIVIVVILLGGCATYQPRYTYMELSNYVTSTCHSP